MKSITVKIKVPAEIRSVLEEYYNDKTLTLELKEECMEFMWDIYRALKQHGKDIANANKKSDAA